MVTLTDPFQQSVQCNTFQVENAQINWSDDSSPRSIKFDDVYASSSGAIEESTHVFLEGCQLQDRWQNHFSSAPRYTVGEIGFGSGLNFLLTWQLWQRSETKPQRLHYIGFEKHPLHKADMERILRRWPSLTKFSNTLMQHYQEHSHICQRLQLAKDITLDIYTGDALTRLQTIVRTSLTGVDSWFLDGFSPTLNPDLWQASLCEELSRLSQPQATVSTYSAAGWVRRHLQDAGFTVSKADGFGAKRHMTKGVLNPELRPNEASVISSKTPWNIYPATNHPRSATVIGAGLAGCSTAYALARRGVQVTLVDSNNAIAKGASGIKQLALRPRLFNTPSALAEYYLQSFLFSIHQFQTLNTEAKPFWHSTGVIQLASALNKKNALAPEVIQSLYGNKIATSLTTQQASSHSGVSFKEAALWLELGGWVNPSLLCNTYIGNENIRLVTECSISNIKRTQSGWECFSPTADDPIRSDIVVFANSHGALEFNFTDFLPLQGIRGQASYSQGTENSSKLRTVITGARSIFPADDDCHTISASYRRELNQQRLTEDDEANINTMATEFKEFAGLSSATCDAGVAIRCNSADFTPVVGQVPDVPAMEFLYKNLGLNANARFDSSGHYLPGLYTNLAHGSNGVATIPLASEYLASLICSELSPLNGETMAALNGVRFIIREIKKQKRRF